MEATKDNQLTDFHYSYLKQDETGIFQISIANTLPALREKIAPLRFRMAAKDIAKELNLQPQEKVLEVGSGLGLLGKQIKDIVGSELAYYGIELAFNPASKSKKNEITPIQADAVLLPFGPDSFDAVITTDVLEHIPDVQEAIAEIYRVLKPDGRVFVVIADPSEGRFSKVESHINRTESDSDVKFWEEIFLKKGFKLLGKESKKYRNRDWRRIFNLPFLVRLKDKPGFACAFNPVNRPGTYILRKPLDNVV